MKADYERFMRDLEQVATTMGNINVVGIADGVSDELTELIVGVLRLKHKARYIGGRASATEEVP